MARAVFYFVLNAFEIESHWKIIGADPETLKSRLKLHDSTLTRLETQAPSPLYASQEQSLVLNCDRTVAIQNRLPDFG